MTKQLFNKHFFSQNRQKLASNSQNDLIIIPAAGLIQRSADTLYKFKQSPNFWYLTGISEPDMTLVIDKRQDQTYIIAGYRHKHRDAWDGAVDLNLVRANSGIAEIIDYHSGWKRLRLSVKSSQKIGILEPKPTYNKTHGYFQNPTPFELKKRIKRLNPSTSLEDLSVKVAEQRQVKQAPEIAAIKQAINITLAGIDEVRQAANRLKNECQAEAILSQVFISSGASGHAFQPIVASAKNATTIHYTANNSLIRPDQFLLLDVGAEYNEYSADISRTLTVGTPTERHLQIYQAVLSAQAFAYSLLRSGKKLQDLEVQVCDFIGQKLLELRLISKPSKEQIRRYYPHSFSHHLGLDVHDVANYTLPLEPNNVITVEPGIYVPEEGIGVRIEDDVLITSNGYLVLSNPTSTKVR
jgi:Xaa-Pro aminopeptidase